MLRFKTYMEAVKYAGRYYDVMVINEEIYRIEDYFCKHPVISFDDVEIILEEYSLYDDILYFSILYIETEMNEEIEIYGTILFRKDIDL